MKNSYSRLVTAVSLVFTLLGCFSEGAAAQVLHDTFAAGGFHSLSVHADGTLWATGDNTYGQLGTGNSTSTTAWVQVGTETNWVMVAAGFHHSLGLKANGSLYSWGSNEYGQLGKSANSGTTTANATPTQVTGTYLQVAAGQYHSLALKADGSLYAWGANQYGQLGNTTNTINSNANPTPAQVAGTYTQIAAGYSHSLGLKADGTLYAWGYNEYGQLGNSTNNSTGTVTANTTPTQVAGTWMQVAAGQYHSLGIKADGTLYTWGYNRFGQLGTTTNSGSTAANPTPAQVSGTWTQVAAGSYHSLALKADGTLYAWGFNYYGQLGNTSNNVTANANPTPAQVTGTYIQVAAGGNHSLGLKAGAALAAWGLNQYGQLGTGSSSATPNPTPTTTGKALPTRSTAIGSNFGLAVRGDGTLWAWGDNTYGQLGTGNATAKTKPVQVGTATDWVMVAAGALHGMGLKADGSVYTWGYNRYGQLGTTTNSGTTADNSTPVQVAGTYTQVAAGYSHSLALKADGTLFAWGLNQRGPLGSTTNSGTTTPNPTPAQATGTYARVAAGAYYSLGLKADGSLYAWGLNQYGQLGNSTNSGATTANPTPLLVAGSYTQVTAGDSHSLALKADGTLYAWGQNFYGQLGSATDNGLFTANYTPAQVAGTYAQVAAGQYHSLALAADGSLYAWGSNRYGQLGNSTNSGTTTANPVPTQEATASTNWTTLAAGPTANSSLVRTASAQTFASAGLNIDSQLGDGTTTNASRFDRSSPLSSLQSLPVELVSFQAWRTGPTVQLLWATASEKNNNGFGVEKSEDGRVFRTLGFVAGAAAAHAYAFMDKEAAGAAYYRLAQTDTDGQITYSPVRFVAGMAASPVALLLVPNPARGGVVQVLGVGPTAVLSLRDGQGRLVRSGVGALLEVAGVPAGLYLLQAAIPGQAPLSARLALE